MQRWLTCFCCFVGAKERQRGGGERKKGRQRTRGGRERKRKTERERDGKRWRSEEFPPPARIHTQTHTHAHKYKHTHVHIHTQTHTHIHTHEWFRPHFIAMLASRTKT